MNRILVFALVGIIVVGIGIALWSGADPDTLPAASGGVLAVPDTYETEGGQEMAPRFGGKGQSDDDFATN